MIKSFSGCHAYDPHCLELAIDEEQVDPVERVNELTAFIDRNICPRCQTRPLKAPAGSRITDCRCIPICGPCGRQESELLSDPDLWPITEDFHKRMCVHVLGGVPQYGPVMMMSLTGDNSGGGVLMDEDGVTQVEPRPNPGGWVEFGFND